MRYLLLLFLVLPLSVNAQDKTPYSLTVSWTDAQLLYFNQINATENIPTGFTVTFNDRIWPRVGVSAQVARSSAEYFVPYRGSYVDNTWTAFMAGASINHGRFWYMILAGTESTRLLRIAGSAPINPDDIESALNYAFASQVEVGTHFLRRGPYSLTVSVAYRVGKYGQWTSHAIRTSAGLTLRW